MPWHGRERRRGPRPTLGTPTYIVERDAPEWQFPQPFWARWKRTAIKFVKGIRYDAYPDHEVPFEDLLRHMPVVPPKARPRSRHGEVYLMVIGRKNARLVPLHGASLDHINMAKRMIQGWIAYEIHQVVDQVIAADEENDKGQGLAEYALILALIAIVAIVALLLLGGQIADILEDVANQIPGGATPAP